MLASSMFNTVDRDVTIVGMEGFFSMPARPRRGGPLFRAP